PRRALALRYLLRMQFGLGVVLDRAHDAVPEGIRGVGRRVVVDDLVDRDQVAYLEQRLDHVRALDRELLREVRDDDRVADRDRAADGGRRPGEAVFGR